MRAICVDDEELILARTVSLVKKTKIFATVGSYTDVVEALASLDEEAADLALLDIDMPEMGGLAAYSAICNFSSKLGFSLRLSIFSGRMIRSNG